MVLSAFGTAAVRRPLLTLGRLLRTTGLSRALATDGRFGFAMGMLAATAGPETRHAGPAPSAPPHPSPFPRTTVALFRGCVMDDLFGHVHDATRRTLEVNGYRVVEVSGQVCCGALHEHAGDRRGAERLARRNIASFAGRAELIVVNSAGCGALLKDYGQLTGSAEARQFAAQVRDVSELLADRGPVAGAELPIEVAYDAPCHLMHAQKVHDQVLAVLRAVPSLRLRLLPGFERCCGSAGIFSLLEPGMSRAVLDDKLRAIAAAEPRPAVIATGNPGCLMQIGAGVRAAGLDIEVRHPVELLDWSYRRAGRYH
jgi:glycolate oxidase iron-sulfur subunit